MHFKKSIKTSKKSFTFGKCSSERASHTNQYINVNVHAWQQNTFKNHCAEVAHMYSKIKKVFTHTLFEKFGELKYVNYAECFVMFHLNRIMTGSLNIAVSHVCCTSTTSEWFPIWRKTSMKCLKMALAPLIRPVVNVGHARHLLVNGF